MEIPWSLSLSKGIQRNPLPRASLFENEEEAREGEMLFSSLRQAQGPGK